MLKKATEKEILNKQFKEAKNAALQEIDELSEDSFTKTLQQHIETELLQTNSNFNNTFTQTLKKSVKNKDDSKTGKSSGNRCKENKAPKRPKKSKIILSHVKPNHSISVDQLELENFSGRLKHNIEFQLYETDQKQMQELSDLSKNDNLSSLKSRNQSSTNTEPKSNFSLEHQLNDEMSDKIPPLSKTANPLKAPVSNTAEKSNDISTPNPLHADLELTENTEKPNGFEEKPSSSSESSLCEIPHMTESVVDQQINKIFDESRYCPGRLASFASHSSSFETSEKSPIFRYIRTAFLFLDDPFYSDASFIYAMFYLVMVIMSVVVMILLSITSIVQNPKNLSNLGWVSLFLCIFFSFDYFTRLLLCPIRYKLSFIIEPLNLVDILSLIPWYIEFALYGFGLPLDDSSASVAVLRSFRIFRFARLFHLLRSSIKAKIFLESIKRITGWIFFLFLLLLCLVTFLGCVMYYLENMSTVLNPEDGILYYKNDPVVPCDFQNILEGMYWAMTTITTVGYGDLTPRTWQGQLFASLTMFVGIFFVSLPIAFLGNAYSKTISVYQRFIKHSDIKLTFKDKMKKIFRGDSPGNESDQRKDDSYRDSRDSSKTSYLSSSFSESSHSSASDIEHLLQRFNDEMKILEDRVQGLKSTQEKMIELLIDQKHKKASNP